MVNIVSLGSETLVNTSTEGSQDRGKVIRLPDGGYVITWMDQHIPGDGDILLQRYDADNLPVGAQTRVNTTTTNSQEWPSIALLSDGGFVVTWMSYWQDGDSGGIYSQRYGADGLPAGAEALVNMTTAGHQTSPAVTALKDGGYIVSWQNGSALAFQRYDASGGSVGSETHLTTADYGLSATSLADGGFLVTWSDGQGIFTQRYDSSSNSVGSPTLVTSGVFGTMGYPVATVLSDGSYVVAWTSYDSTSGDVFMRHYDANGVALGGEARVNTGTFNQQHTPFITALSDGGYVITWYSYGVGAMLQRYDEAGSPVGVEMRISSSDARPTSLVELIDGRLLVSWDAQDGSYSGIYKTIVELNAAALTTDKDVATGTAGADVITVGAGGLTAGDRIDGGGGTDILRLSGGGTNTLVGVTLANVEQIELTNAAGTTLRLSDASQAALLTTATGAADTVILNSGSFTVAQRRALFDAGVERVTDAQGTYQSTNVAPVTTADVVSHGEDDGSPVLVLSNDSDAEGDTLSIVANSLQVTGFTTSPGLVLPAPGGPEVDMNFLLNVFFVSGTGINIGNTSNFNFLDPGQSITVTMTYQVTDNVANVSTATLTYTITGALEVINSTATSDNRVGTAFGDLFDGLAGDDTMHGGSGNDLIYGGLGDDTLFGDDGNDSIAGDAGDDILYGGSGSDTLTGGTGQDMLSGGSGNDTLDGGDGGDTLSGGSGADLLLGGGGADTILGGDDSDVIYGEDGGAGGIAGDDWIEGGAGNDVIFGQDGSDTIYGQQGDDTVVGGAGNDIIIGGTGNDTLQGDGGADTIAGGDGNDLILGDGTGGGTAGNDWIEAGAGNDTILGEAGNDTILGQDGNDIIYGGQGFDVLHGGAGYDNFHFLNPNDGFDYIGDFTRGQDALVFQSASFGGLNASTIGSKFYSGAGFSGFAVSGPFFAFDTTTGNLWYNDNGTAKLIAQVANTALQASDLYFA